MSPVSGTSNSQPHTPVESVDEKKKQSNNTATGRAVVKEKPAGYYFFTGLFISAIETMVKDAQESKDKK